MKKNSMVALILAMTLLVSSGALAQTLKTSCEMTDSASDCWLHILDATNPPEVQAANKAAIEEKQVNELLSKPTGVQTGGSNLRSNTTDFLPLIAMSGLLGNVQQGDTEGTYVFDLNFLIPGIEKDSKLRAVVNSKPKVSDAIKSQLPETGRDDLVKKLEGSLGDLSDYDFSYTFNWNNRTHGRNFRQYRDRFEALVTALNLGNDPDTGLRELGDFLFQHPELSLPLGDDFSVKFSDVELSGLSGEALESARKELKAKFEAAATDAADRLVRHRKEFVEAGLESFASLVDNQPQLTFAAQKSFRDPLVGGDELSGKVTYEIGWPNLNNAGLPENCAQATGTCLTAYTGYVTKNKDGLKSSNKLSFSAEYADIGKETFGVASQGLTGLKIAAAKKVIVSAGWGRTFPDPMGGDQPLRIDFVGKYEDVSDDPMRQDRGVATLTVTRTVGGVTIPLGIVYANHGEFLGDVDKKFSAHVGLKFDLGGQKKTQGQ